MIIPLVRHFLSGLRALDDKAIFHQQVNVSAQVLAYLKLWMQFLAKSHDGINMNLLTYRMPSVVIYTDAFPWRLGGLSYISGLARKWELPANLVGRVSINLLETQHLLVYGLKYSMIKQSH